MTTFRFVTFLSLLLNLTLLAVPVTSLAQATTPTVPPPAAPVTTPVPPAPAVEMVDLNTADVATLDRLLDGIGEKRAQAIVDFREQHGPFKTIYDLELVSGIGPKTIERNKHRMMVSVPETPATPAADATSTPPVAKDEESSQAEAVKEAESEETEKSK